MPNPNTVTDAGFDLDMRDMFEFDYELYAASAAQGTSPTTARSVSAHPAQERCRHWREASDQRLRPVSAPPSAPHSDRISIFPPGLRLGDCPLVLGVNSDLIPTDQRTYDLLAAGRRDVPEYLDRDFLDYIASENKTLSTSPS